MLVKTGKACFTAFIATPFYPRHRVSYSFVDIFNYMYFVKEKGFSVALIHLTCWQHRLHYNIACGGSWAFDSFPYKFSFSQLHGSNTFIILHIPIYLELQPSEKQRYANNPVILNSGLYKPFSLTVSSSLLFCTEYVILAAPFLLVFSLASVLGVISTCPAHLEGDDNTSESNTCNYLRTLFTLTKIRIFPKDKHSQGK